MRRPMKLTIAPKTDSVKSLIQKEVKELVLERQGDFNHIDTAVKSYSEIYSFLVMNAREVPTVWDSMFGKDQDGRYMSIILSKFIPRPEHERLKLFFVEKNFQPQYMRPKTAGLATPYDPATGYAEIKLGFRMVDYLDGDPVPEDVNLYNEWFRANISKVFKKLRTTYVHELTHILDYGRVKAEWMALRKKVKDADQSELNDLQQQISVLGMKFKRLRKPETKQLAQSSIDNLSKQVDAKKAALHSQYINDPLELNGYFNETLSKFIFDLKNLKDKTPEGIMSVVGRSPQEFADKFMDRLHSSAKKSITDDNARKYMKRIATLYDKIITKYIKK